MKRLRLQRRREKISWDPLPKPSHQLPGEARVVAEITTRMARLGRNKDSGNDSVLGLHYRIPLVGNLYGQIFYLTGGVGDRELYRDPVKTQNLFDRIESWVPELPSDYDPGWHYRRRPSETAYSDSIKYLKSVRLAQLRNYAMLVRDNEYYAAESELEDLKKRNPKGIVTGSNDGNRSAELFQIMNRVIERIGKPEMPPERPFVFTPDPDADFKQVFVGFNGPEHGGATLIQSRSEATASWLSSSLSVHDLDRILLQVNFDSQILVVFAIGERVSATGQVHVMDASYNSTINAYSVNGVVGVNIESCKLPHTKSYPYAVVIAPRPPMVPKGSGYGVSNFGDGCKQPMAGQPTTVSMPTNH